MALNMTLREEVLVEKARARAGGGQQRTRRRRRRRRNILQHRGRTDARSLQCCGRRVCSECGKGYNVADINAPATATQPAIVMPPLMPPAKCAHKMTTRPDDTPEVVRARLAVYRAECGPVEQFYAADGRLAHFEVAGGIPETLPRLLADILALLRAQSAK